MSAARVIQFPGTVRSRREISGPRAGLMNRPKEREPSPERAWPWIIFSGEGVRIVDSELGYFDELTEQERVWVEQMLATLEAPCDYARWTRLDAWTLQQAVCIIGGIDPAMALGTMNCFLSKYGRADKPARYEVFRACAMFAESLKPMLEEMRGSHFAGKLKVLGPWLEDLTLVDPSEVIRWAASKGYDIPPELEHQAEGVEGGREEQAAWVEPKTPKELTPKEFVSQMKAREADPSEIIAGLELRWPKMQKYRVGAFAKGLDPDDQTTRKQAEAHFRRHKQK